MPLITWSNEYSIGVPEIDREHRQLIELINRLYKDLGDDSSKTGVEEFLNEIHTNMSTHFAHEEKVMLEHDYDQYTEHKADHSLLLDEIKELQFDYEATYDFEKEALGEHLKRWFITHFKHKDARLHKKIE